MNKQPLGFQTRKFAPAAPAHAVRPQSQVFGILALRKSPAPRLLQAPRPIRSLRRPPLWRQFEAGKVEARRDGAAEERPVAERLRRLPGTSRHRRLGSFAAGEVAAERQSLDASRRVGDFKQKRRARIPMPELNGVNAMPVRALAARQQKIDRGGRTAADPPPTLRRPRRVGRGRIAKGLAEMAALRMRLELKQPDDVCRGEFWRGQR